ncbi:L-seryl-tRNA(Sec) kinase [Lingula anatina]|uniref:L-seryl-tRNA(Sec) kinase n=1 Tax=Lingula anatina TaxID=7574 RepID=A0A1S3H3I1_LINAN|nr:L-seryl-tRNA(Sec) kinase [Lingula anatina]|eukprot:XP_013379694.1 L-seryl-tRNA(Sec) kinase [Lingula anatina]
MVENVKRSGNTCIFLLCGLPGSGKTTLCKRLLSEAAKCQQKSAELNLKLYHVCYDELLPVDTERTILQTVSEEGCSQWKKYRRNIIKCLDQKIASILGVSQGRESEIPAEIQLRFEQLQGIKSYSELDKTNHVFLIDDNLYYRSMRYEYYQLARKYEIGFGEAYISCDVETALQRNQTREQAIPEEVIVTMATRLEPPDPEEAWEQNSIALDEFSSSVDSVLQFMNHVLHHPVQRPPEEDMTMKEESRITCSENLIHQADQILRKLIGLHIALKKETQTHIPEGIKTFAQKLNGLKSEILKDLKTGVLLVPSGVESQVVNASKNMDCAFHTFIQDIFHKRAAYLQGNNS